MNPAKRRKTEVRTDIECLPNELWLTVFNYLDWINLFSTFYGINKRINQLLMSINTLSIYSSYLITHSNSIYIFFQEFPLKEFKQIQHLQLIYDDPYKDPLSITKDFASFSTLVSLTVNAHCGQFRYNNELLLMIIFRQNCPLLRRLYLDGNVFDQELQIVDNSFTFHFSSLLYIHVSKLHLKLALQILNQCPQLRSFSTKFYGELILDDLISYETFLSTHLNMNLPAMTKLSLSGENQADIGLGNEFGKDFGSIFLKLLLSRCLNLRTFIFDIRCCGDWERLLEADWWSRVFASHNKLKQISLHLQWKTRAYQSIWHQKCERFKSSSFFAEFKVNIRSDCSSEFLRSVTYDLYLEN